jgi:hypothetical protein
VAALKSRTQNLHAAGHLVISISVDDLNAMLKFDYNGAAIGMP